MLLPKTGGALIPIGAFAVLLIVGLYFIAVELVKRALIPLVLIFIALSIYVVLR